MLERGWTSGCAGGKTARGPLPRLELSPGRDIGVAGFLHRAQTTPLMQRGGVAVHAAKYRFGSGVGPIPYRLLGGLLSSWGMSTPDAQGNDQTQSP